MPSQATTEQRSGSISRKGHRSGSGTSISGTPVDQVNNNRTVNLVPSSPYMDMSSVASVSSENGIASPYTNPSSYLASPYPNHSSYLASPYPNHSSYLASPYPNPASNIENVSTPFNIDEDNLLRNVTTFQNNTESPPVPSPAPSTSNAKKRNSGPQSTQLLNGSSGESSTSENSGPSDSKKIKTSTLPEFSEAFITDIISLIEEEQHRGNETAENDPAIEEHSTSNVFVEVKTEQSHGNEAILTDDDICKADNNVLDCLVLKYTLEAIAEGALDASRKIGPETPFENVQRLTKLINTVITLWKAEWMKLPKQPFTPQTLVNKVVGSTGQSQNFNPVSTPYNSASEIGLQPSSPAPTNFNLTHSNRNQSQNSRYTSAFPQVAQQSPPTLMRNNSERFAPASSRSLSVPGGFGQVNSLVSSAGAVGPRSLVHSGSAAVVDGLGSVHSLGSSTQNGLQTGLQNLHSMANFTFPTNVNPYDHSRLQGVSHFPASNVAAARGGQMTFYSVPNSSPATVASPPPRGNFQAHFRQRPVLPMQENQTHATYARSPSEIGIIVGNTTYTFSHNDWAEVTESNSLRKMTNSLFDKFFTTEERLNCTVSGRKSKSGLPGLDPSKMLALYACMAFLQSHPKQFPSDHIDASFCTLNDKDKTKIKTIVAQKLNSCKQKQLLAKRQDGS